VGDGMRSVFVLDVDEGNGVIHGDQRDMGTCQVLGMEGVKDGGEGVVVADVSSTFTTWLIE
jgi:DNA damage-binding protein 1